jgi:BolA protein
MRQVFLHKQIRLDSHRLSLCDAVIALRKRVNPMNPVESRIYTKLGTGFQPVHLEVINESYMHSVPPGSETHFKVVLASAQFAGKRQVQRHQAIYACLAEELQSGVHALALHTLARRSGRPAARFQHLPNVWGAVNTTHNKCWLCKN